MSTLNQDAQERLNLLREIELTTARINEQNRQAATATGAELQQLEQRQFWDDQHLQGLRANLAALNSLKKLTKESLTNFDSLDDTIASIGNTLQNNAALQNTFNTKLDAAKTTLTSVASMVEASSFDDRQLKHIDAAGKGYANMNTSIAAAASNLQNGKISQQEYNEIVKQSFESFDNLLSAIDTSTQAGKDLVEVFRRGRETMASFEQGAQRSAAALDAMNGAVDQFGSSGIPLAREFSSALGDIVNTGKLGKAALIALGAAAGKLAYDYFGAGVKASVKAANDVKQTQIDGAYNVAQAQNELAFAAKQAASDFGFQLQSMAAQFNAASKTALFGKGLGSVGYAASQLQLAGISAETIATATAAASKSGSGSTKLAADMAIFSERSGISVDNLANVQQAFKLLDGVSAGTALNMAEGTRAMAEQAGLNVGDIMNEVASASEMALSYQIQSGNALARQVVFAKSLGVSFNEVAKAGQSMVLNYKDSIKAEMSLSAMLGKNVDLSEVRAKFASGDTEGAMESLRAQGLDPSQMNMFQQEALKNATGGMDLNTLQKIATPGFQEGVGNVGTLEEKSAKAENEAFLALKQNSAAALATQEALISAQKAVADAAINEMKEIALKTSDAYTQYLADMAKLDIDRMFSENLGGALAAGAGGLAGNFLPGLFKGGGAPVPPGGPTPPGGAGGMLGKAGKFLTKGGGAALGGVFGGISGFMNKKEEGGTTGQAVGAGLLQGGLAASGAALGAAFGGPLGAIAGGFLGDSLGGWINENAPGVAARFGGIWDSMMGKFDAIGEAFKPIKESIDGFMQNIGFEGGLGEAFSTIAEFVGNVLMQPFNVLISVFGFLFDIVTAVLQVFSGEGGMTKALETLKTGFLDLISNVFAPFTGVFVSLYKGFAAFYNGIADSYIGQQIGLGKMDEKKLDYLTASTEKSVAVEQQKAAAVAANAPVVAAATATTKINEELNKKQQEALDGMKHAGNLQNRMISLLGASAILLEEIVYNTAGERPISLDGKVLNKKLFDNSNKTYGIAQA